MKDHGERLLEYLLREHFAGDAGDAALAPRLRRLLESPGAPSPRPHVRQHRWLRQALRLLPWVAAAAAVAGVWLLQRAPVLATAERPLLVLTADGQLRRTQQLRAGDLAWCAEAGPLAFALAAGRAVAEPGALLRFEPAGIELQAGAVQLLPGGTDLLARCAFGSVRAAPGADVRLHCEPDAPLIPDPLEADPMRSLALLTEFRSRSLAVSLAILPLTGTAELLTAQGRTPLPAGQAVQLPPPRVDAAALARARTLLANLRKDTDKLDLQDEQNLLLLKQVDEDQQDLTMLLMQQPELLPPLREGLRKDLAAAATPPAVVGRLLGIAALDTDSSALAVLERRWPLGPDAFDYQVQLAMAERGSALVRPALQTTMQEPDSDLAVLSAAALALGGSDFGKAALQPALAIDLHDAADDFRPFDRRAQAAIGMAALGDAQALPRLQADLRAVVGELLERGDLGRAAWMVQRAAVYLRPSPRLSFLQQRIQLAAPELAAKDVAAPLVRSWLDRLTR